MEARKWIGSFVIFMSGYFPLIIIYTILNIQFNLLSLSNYSILVFLWIIFGLCCVLSYLVISGFSKASGRKIRIDKFQDKSGDLLIYTIPYIIALLPIDLSNINFLIGYAFFLMVLFYLMVKSHKIFMNPFLLICGYNLYDVQYTSYSSNKKGQELFFAKSKDMKVGLEVQKLKIIDNVYIILKK